MASRTPNVTVTDIQDTFTTLVSNLNHISYDVGATGSLNTNQDSDLVGSINELELAVRGTSNNLVAAGFSNWWSYCNRPHCGSC